MAWSSPACPQDQDQGLDLDLDLNGSLKRSKYTCFVGPGKVRISFSQSPQTQSPPSPALHQEPAVSGRFGEALALSSAFPRFLRSEQDQIPLCRARLAHPPTNSLCLCSPYVHQLFMFTVHSLFTRTPGPSPRSSPGFRACVPLPSRLSSPAGLASC